MSPTTNPRPTRGSASEAEDCSNCGSPRVVATLAELVGLNRRRPVPAIAAAMESLRGRYSATRLIAICPGCWCITQDLRAHAH